MKIKVSILKALFKNRCRPSSNFNFTIYTIQHMNDLAISEGLNYFRCGKHVCLAYSLSGDILIYVGSLTVQSGQCNCKFRYGCVDVREILKTAPIFKNYVFGDCHNVCIVKALKTSFLQNTDLNSSETVPLTDNIINASQQVLNEQIGKLWIACEQK